jgi:hypothetical protein
VFDATFSTRKRCPSENKRNEDAPFNSFAHETGPHGFHHIAVIALWQEQAVHACAGLAFVVQCRRLDGGFFLVSLVLLPAITISVSLSLAR